MFSVRVGCCSAFALGFVQALPAITVQYEQDPPPSLRSVVGSDFNDRATRLAERVGRSGALLESSLRSAPASFALVAPAIGLGQVFQKVSPEAMVDALRAEGLPISEVHCAHDYNVPCPAGWVDLGDGGSCAAPVSYNGPCGGLLGFKGLPAHEKMQLAESCGVVFPCDGACTADYNRPCPDGWVHDGGVSCAAPAGYNGPCSGKISFAQYAFADKAMFEHACSVRWPCRRPWSKVPRPDALRDCKADYGVQCPHGWSSNGVLCVAPVSYAGPCAVVADMRGYSIEEKRVVAQHCASEWPCTV